MKKYKKTHFAPARWSMYDWEVQHKIIDHVPFVVFFGEKINKYYASIYMRQNKGFYDLRKRFDTYEEAFDYGERFMKKWWNIKKKKKI